MKKELTIPTIHNVAAVIAAVEQPLQLLPTLIELADYKAAIDAAKKAHKEANAEFETKLKEASKHADELEAKAKEAVIRTYEYNDVVKVDETTGIGKTKRIDNLGKNVFIYKDETTEVAVDREALFATNKFTKMVPVIDEEALKAHIDLLGFEGLPTKKVVKPVSVGFQWTKLKEAKKLLDEQKAGNAAIGLEVENE